MIDHGAKQLASAFRKIRKDTITIAEEIAEQHYAFRPATNTRSVAETLVHIALSPNIMYQIHGLERRSSFEGFDFASYLEGMLMEEAKPRTKREIVTMLQEEGDRYSAWLESLPDTFLNETIVRPTDQPGWPTRTRFAMVMSPREHEGHHQGQLMLIERILGLVPHSTREMEETGICTIPIALRSDNS